VRLGLPDSRGHVRLLVAFAADALGTGFFLPFSLLFFTATTPVRLTDVGIALSVAAVVRIPATAAAGVLIDRFGARAAIIASNLIQAGGFAGYLFVDSFWHLLLTAVVVQIGNSVFWVAYPALVHDVARPGQQERWFALITALRNAGLALGALGASAAVAFGGTRGYQAIALLNAASFLLAAAMTAGWRGARVRRGTRDRPERPARSRWAGVLRDRPFLTFVALNVGFVLLSLAFVLAVPVFLVEAAGLPNWMPGAVLAVNAVLGAVGATAVVAAITGRRRGAVLAASQLLIGAGYAAILAAAYTPALVALGVAVLGTVLVTLTELIQGPTVSAIVNEAGSDADRGRYISIYQMTFSVVDIIAPALLTALLARGPAAAWVPLIVLAAGNALLLPSLSRRLPALRRPVGDAAAGTASTARIAEGDAL
jgi:MFS family permease